MRLQAFQVAVVNQVKQRISRDLRNFRARTHFTLFKLYYSEPKIHYEVWVRGKDRLIEVGLHFESTKKRNDELIEYFQECAIEIIADLGHRIEIEQWTSSWSRIHEVVPYQELDSDLTEKIAEKLARMITVLEPRLRAQRKPRRGKNPARA